MASKHEAALSQKAEKRVKWKNEQANDTVHTDGEGGMPGRGHQWGKQAGSTCMPLANYLANDHIRQDGCKSL